MGIQSHRAGDAREASRVIETTPIHVAVVDLALPLEGSAREEAGPRVLELLARLSTPPPTLVIKRGRTSRDDQREMAAALKAGAFAVLDRPRVQEDMERLLELFRRVLIRHYANRWPDQSPP
jgi:CheY-like chemotaxis protein